MGAIKYTLKIDGVVAAEHMELETACILLEALFQKAHAADLARKSELADRDGLATERDT